MSRQCSVSICKKQPSGYSTLCDAHKQTLRRHGHAEQQGVTVFELKPYQDRVEARRAKNPGNPTWAMLGRRWEALGAHAEDTLSMIARGASGFSFERQTAEQLVLLRDTVAGDVVIDAALAMFAMSDQRPGRFKSDKAFAFQLSRRVRGLSRSNSGTYRDAKTGREKHTYRDTPPRTLACFAASLTAAFGVAGMRLSELDKSDAEGVQAERQDLHDALREMT